jgi:hypothetical protein
MASEPEQERPEGDEEERVDDVGTEGEPSSEESQEALSPAEGAERPAKKRAMPPSRIAFLIFVVIASVAIVFEWRARTGYTRTVEALEQAYQTAQEKGKAFYREDLEKVIHGSPSRERDEQARTEMFTWRGIRPHRLKVEYGNLDFVHNYSTP